MVHCISYCNSHFAVDQSRRSIWKQAKKGHDWKPLTMAKNMPTSQCK